MKSHPFRFILASAIVLICASVVLIAATRPSSSVFHSPANSPGQPQTTVSSAVPLEQYTNSALHFSLRYPHGWWVYNKQDGVELATYDVDSERPSSGSAIDIQIGTLPKDPSTTFQSWITDYLDSTSATDEPFASEANGTIISIKDFGIPCCRAFEVERTTSPPSPDSPRRYGVYVEGSDPALVFVISTGPTSPELQQVQQILATFSTSSH